MQELVRGWAHRVISGQSYQYSIRNAPLSASFFSSFRTTGTTWLETQLYHLDTQSQSDQLSQPGRSPRNQARSEVPLTFTDMPSGHTLLRHWPRMPNIQQFQPLLPQPVCAIHPANPHHGADGSCVWSRVRIAHRVPSVFLRSSLQPSILAYMVSTSLSIYHIDGTYSNP